MTIRELAEGYAALYNDARSVVKATLSIRSVHDFDKGAEAAGLSVRAERVDNDMQCIVDNGFTMVIDLRRSLTLFSREGCSVDTQSADVVVEGFWDASEALEGEAIFELMQPQMVPSS